MSSRSGSWALVLMWIAVTGCAGSGGDDGVPIAGAGGIGIAGSGIAAAAGVSGGAGTSAGAGASGLGASGLGGSGAGAGGAGTAPTFTRVWNEVLVRKGCAGEFCHGSGQGGLSMDNQADAYMNLVGVAAAGPQCGSSGKTRVQASNPDGSLLLEKMSNALPSCGEAMPVGVKFEPNCLSPDPSVCTTQAELQLVRDWIAAGALND